MLNITAPAKINLALNVKARRPDGYHEVDMIMQTITLADQLSFENHPQIELTCSHQGLAVDNRNLIWKAATLLKEITGCSSGAKIHLTKNIPIAAGMAGGSSDAAATLLGLNQLWNLGLTKEELMELGVKIGADVPFCILHGTARAQGIGEKLTPIQSMVAGTPIMLVTPNIEVPTKSIYQHLQLDRIISRPQIDEVIDALEVGDLAKLQISWGNVLEEVALREFPMIRHVKEFFAKFGFATNLMTGSGPTVFALNPPQDLIQPFLAALPDRWFGCLTQFVS